MPVLSFHFGSFSRLKVVFSWVSVLVSRESLKFLVFRTPTSSVSELPLKKCLCTPGAVSRVYAGNIQELGGNNARSTMCKHTSCPLHPLILPFSSQNTNTLFCPQEITPLSSGIIHNVVVNTPPYFKS